MLVAGYAASCNSLDADEGSSDAWGVAALRFIRGADRGVWRGGNAGRGGGGVPDLEGGGVRGVVLAARKPGRASLSMLKTCCSHGALVGRSNAHAYTYPKSTDP